MALIGSILHAILLFLLLIPVTIVMVLGRLFLSEPVRYRVGMFWCKAVIYVLRFLCGVKWRVQGKENMPTDPNARIVVLCKHQSAWETMALNALLGEDLIFVFKKELLKIPLFGWAIGSVDMIHIDRSAKTQAMQKILEQSIRLIDKNRWVLMFPEGTRAPRGVSTGYKAGGARLAVAANANILPIALSSGKCWPRGAFIKKPGTIDVVIGPVIQTQGKETHEITKEVEAWIEGQMRLIDPEAYQTEKRDATEAPDKRQDPVKISVAANGDAVVAETTETKEK